MEKSEENQRLSKEISALSDKFDTRFSLSEGNFHKELNVLKNENNEIKRISSEIKQKNKILFEENKEFCQELSYLKDLECRNQEEKTNLQKFLNENIEEINFLKKELERSRSLKDEFSLELEKNASKYKSFELEIEDLMKKIEIISHEKNSIEELELKDQDIIHELEKNNINLLDENKYQKDYIIKLETQFNFIKKQQNQVFL